MKQKLAHFVLAVCLASSLASCDKEEKDINKEREVFISDNVTLRIMFPEANESIEIHDTISGFTSWIQNEEINFAPIIIEKDSIKHNEKKYYISLNVDFRDTKLSNDKNGLRKFECNADASFLMDTLKTASNKKPLLVSPSSGYINDKKLELQGGLLPNEKQPYLIITAKAKQIR